MLSFFKKAQPGQLLGYTTAEKVAIKLSQQCPPERDYFSRYVNRAHWIRIYNVLLAVAVSYYWYRHPRASKSELGPDLVIHLLQAWLTTDSSLTLKLASMGLNLHRVLTIFERLCFRDASLPMLFNVLDIFNHLLNVVSTLEGMLIKLSENPQPT